ncbi:class I SAM-dependent methyltransferase [bacterium]|nr:class I SAM-dependent methyltransferase [bacterium]
MINSAVKTKPKDFIANYEMNNYKYSDFWIGREYEHEAEIFLLQNIVKKHLPDLQERELVDLGGAYGRLLTVYGKQAKRIVLADYSTNELRQGLSNVMHSPIKGKISFLALNAYKMPFGDNTVDALLSVRVMHHLKDIHLFFSDLARVLKPGGKAIIEFANKNHLLSLFRHAKKLDLSSFLREDVTQVTHRKDSQGIKTGQLSIMYNFSYKYIKEKAQVVGLGVEASYACSFLRSTFFKHIFDTPTLLKLESVFQKLFCWTRITPSVFIVLSKKGEFIATDDSVMAKLFCPTCSAALKKANAGCLSCPNGHEFQQNNSEIIDLRDPRPEVIDF